MVLGASWGWSALSDADCFSCLTAFSQSPAHKRKRSVGKLAGSWQEVNVVRGPYAFELAAEVALCMSSVMGGLQVSSASAAAPHNRIRTCVGIGAAQSGDVPDVALLQRYILKHLARLV
jgi:hypothetical protein